MGSIKFDSIKNIILTLILLFIFTGCETKKRQENTSNCLKEYELYKESVSKYKVRMQDMVKTQGCEVISIYSYIIQAEQFDILDKVDENPKVIKKLIKLFSINKNFSSLLLNNSQMKEILINNSLHDDFIENFSYIVKRKWHKNEIRKIEKDGNYLNYVLLASLYAKDRRDSLRLYKKLKSSISIELMPSFSLILSSVGEKYTFEDLLENFTVLKSELSTDAIQQLAVYPQYFAYFLYPKKEELGIDAISTVKLREIQKSIQKKVIYIYEEMFNKYRYKNNIKSIDYALLSIEYIYPYLLEQHAIKENDFRELFHHLIKREYLFSLFQEEDKCSDGTKENFAVFAKNNMASAIKLLQNNEEFALTLFSEFKDPKYSIMSFFYVANVYGSFTTKEWMIFKELLKTLPYEYDNKIVFLQRIEKNGYFRNMLQQSNYKEIIDGDYGEKNPKYKYVLLTPYPSQNDSTLFETVLRTDIKDDVLQRSLVDLISKDKDELENHEFTKFEKFFANVDTLSNIATVGSVVLAPFTGGMSLGYFATRVATKVAIKQATKSVIQKNFLHARKTLNKGIRKARVVRKNIDLKIGIKNRDKIGTYSDYVDNGLSSLVVLGRASIFFNSNNLEEKTICQE